jgi:hypothetical protein
LANPTGTNPRPNRATGPRIASETIRALALSQTILDSPMDIERINQIGATLTDLASRTEALRGYL